MIRILFVCLGNICRSTMAEFMFRDMAEKAGLGSRFYIESAGTSAEEAGNPVHRGTRQVLDRLGISCAQKRARKMTAEDYGRFDYLIGMERSNIRSMERICGGDPEHKMSRLLEHAPERYARAGQDVADPWYTGDFEATYRDVKAGCEGLLAELAAGTERAVAQRAGTEFAGTDCAGTER